MERVEFKTEGNSRELHINFIKDISLGSLTAVLEVCNTKPSFQAIEFLNLSVKLRLEKADYFNSRHRLWVEIR